MTSLLAIPSVWSKQRCQVWSCKWGDLGSLFFKDSESRLPTQRAGELFRSDGYTEYTQLAPRQTASCGLGPSIDARFPQSQGETPGFRCGEHYPLFSPFDLLPCGIHSSLLGKAGAQTIGTHTDESLVFSVSHISRFSYALIRSKCMACRAQKREGLRKRSCSGKLCEDFQIAAECTIIKNTHGQ